ncbi:MAG: ABC transporter substrate-binding protein [Rhizobiaceae bacterium]|nr:ABC transporter substrate-binding protein [Rhizobiaceae bacterium]
MFRYRSLIAGVTLAAMSAGPAFSAGSVTLNWNMWSAGDAETAVWQHLADMVHEKYPEITVNLKVSSWGDYWTKLPVRVASGSAGDIIAMQSLRMPNFPTVLEPLDELLKQKNSDLSAFDQSILGGLSYDGTLFALPYDVGPWMIYYNKDMFEAAGVDLPQPGWTWGEFTAAAKKMTTDDQFGVGIFPQNYSVMAGALGDHYLAADGRLDLVSPAAIDAAKKLTELVTVDKVAPVVASSGDPGQLISGRFDSGNIAMYVDGPWVMLTKKKNVKFDLGMTTLPRGDGPLQAVTAGSGFGISKKSQHKEEALKAIEVLTGPDALAYLAKEGRALPARTAQQQYWYDVAAADVFGAREALTYALDHSVTYEITPNFNAVENLFNQYFPLAFSGNQSPEQVMQTIQSLAAQ